MQDVIQLLEQLANKLGVAVEYLWATLVRQQIAEGVTDVIGAAAFLCVTILLICITPHFTKHAVDKYEALRNDRIENGTGYLGSRHTSSFLEDRWRFVATAAPIIAIIVGTATAMIAFSCLSVGIQELINPEYFALKEVLNTIQSATP